jgi:hypothetical protein
MRYFLFHQGAATPQIAANWLASLRKPGSALVFSRSLLLPRRK